MPTATLLQGNTYTIMGRNRFERNQETQVTEDVARYLAGNKRFRIDWGTDKPQPAMPAGSVLPPPTPAGAQPVVEGNGISLTDAIDMVDIDREENFDEAGRPTAEALSAIVERSVSEEERDRALASATRAAPPKVEGDTAPTRTRVIRKKADPTVEGAQDV